MIDYSPFLFKEGVPPTRQGKFLQVVDDGGTELLILSPYESSKYHAQILERYCMLNNLEGRFVKKPEYFLVTGADLEIIGGGHWKIDETNMRLILEGESKVYGRFNAEELSKKVRMLQEFDRYKVVIG